MATKSGDDAGRQTALLRHIRNDSTFSDATLVAGGTETPIHRAVFCQLSPFFARLFERVSSQSGTPRITLQCASAASTQILVDYAYALPVAAALEQDLEVALETLSVASTLSVAPLARSAARAARAGAARDGTAAHEYARVFYALKLCGLEDDARETLVALARDGRIWRNGADGLSRLAAPHMEAAMRSRDLVASEDDLLSAVLAWAAVDPARRRGAAAARLLPLLRWQRLSVRAARASAELAVIAPAQLAALAAARLSAGAALANTAALPVALGTRAICGSGLEWATETGALAIRSSMFGKYLFPTIFSRNYEFPIVVSRAQIEAVGGATCDFQFEFYSFCMSINVRVSSTRFRMGLQIDRRCVDLEKRPLGDALQPVVIICETAVISPLGTPVQNTYGVWPASMVGGFAETGGEPPLKKTRKEGDAGVAEMNLVCVKSLIELLEDMAVCNGAVTLAVRLRTAKTSALRAVGFLNAET